MAAVPAYIAAFQHLYHLTEFALMNTVNYDAGIVLNLFDCNDVTGRDGSGLRRRKGGSRRRDSNSDARLKSFNIRIGRATLS